VSRGVHLVSSRYRPQAGDHVRVTRRQPDGREKFVKQLTILEEGDGWYYAEEKDTGHRVTMSSSEELERRMPGWTQRIERTR
jgi:hypothetical protein